MYIIFFIVLSLALGISVFLLMHRCADARPIPLSSGVLVSFATAVMHVALFCLGIFLGNKFCFMENGDPLVYVKQNALVLLGLSIFVALKQLLPYMGRRTKPASYDLNAGVLQVFLLTIATGTNGFLLGFGVGFVAMLGECLHAALWPLFVMTFLFSVLGIMFGRQHVPLRPRRWMALSSLLLFVTAFCVVIF